MRHLDSQSSSVGKNIRNFASVNIDCLEGKITEEGGNKAPGGGRRGGRGGLKSHEELFPDRRGLNQETSNIFTGRFQIVCEAVTSLYLLLSLFFCDNIFL